MPRDAASPEPRQPDPAHFPAAVLWDMDGTLVDTESYWIRAEHELVESYGGVWTDEFAHQLVGNPLEVSADFIRAHSPVTLEPVELIEALLGRVIAQVSTDVPWRPGALELLTELGSLGVPCALVTMSWRSLADTVVAALAPGAFAALVTGDVVTHGKPHPEAYVAAAGLLGVQLASCVAIEDSPSGVRSAVAAGVPTIAVPHIVPVPQVWGAVQVDTLLGVRAADLCALVGGVGR